MVNESDINSGHLPTETVRYLRNVVTQSFDPSQRRIAQVVLMTSEGMSRHDVAERLGISVTTVGDLLKKFRSKGISAIGEMDRSIERAVRRSSLDSKTLDLVKGIVEARFPGYQLLALSPDGRAIKAYFCVEQGHRLRHVLVPKRPSSEFLRISGKCPVCGSLGITSKEPRYFAVLEKQERRKGVRSPDPRRLIKNLRLRARRANQTCSVTLEDMGECLAHFSSACCYCGSRDDLTVDHVVPVSHGGESRRDNILISCRRCNSSRRVKPLEEWYRSHPGFTQDRWNLIKEWIRGG